MTERTLETRLGWLAGIIDGEGWIGFTVNRYRDPRKQRGHAPGYVGISWRIEISNTNPPMINEIMAIADVLGIKYEFNAWSNHHQPNRKQQARVRFKRKASCRALLVALLPYLVAKRPQAELLLRASQHRERTGRHWRDVKYLRPQDDATFVEMVGDMKRLNHRGLED